MKSSRYFVLICFLCNDCATVGSLAALGKKNCRSVEKCCWNPVSSLCVTNNFTIEETIENITITYNGELIVLNGSLTRTVTLTSIDIADEQTMGVSIEFGKC